jgi:hypothetical protein
VIDVAKKSRSRTNFITMITNVLFSLRVASPIWYLLAKRVTLHHTNTIVGKYDQGKWMVHHEFNSTFL